MGTARPLDFCIGKLCSLVSRLIRLFVELQVPVLFDLKQKCLPFSLTKGAQDLGDDVKVFNFFRTGPKVAITPSLKDIEKGQ